jgi:hypothetical protein
MYAIPTFGLGIVASPTELPIFNVTTRDTEANILASTPTNPSGEVNIAFATDDAGTDNATYTNDFYIYHNGGWYIFNNDS